MRRHATGAPAALRDRVIVTQHPPALVGLTPSATPEMVAADLARALGRLLCHGQPDPLHPDRRDGVCAACRAAGQRLAPAIGAALFACRRGIVWKSYDWRPSARPLGGADLEAVGAALDVLERMAHGRGGPE